jgi:hypothetical protein
MIVRELNTEGMGSLWLKVSVTLVWGAFWLRDFVIRGKCVMSLFIYALEFANYSGSAIYTQS